jgi:hypothetical protein
VDAPKRKNTPLEIIGIIAIVSLVVVGGVKLLVSSAEQQNPHRNYSPQICEDAYKSTTQNENNPDHFDIALHEGCFSGFVSIPKDWRQWQEQLLGDDPTVWVAHWYRGWPEPRGPLSQNQVNNVVQTEMVPSYQLRLQGRGTLRFYRVLP